MKQVGRRQFLAASAATALGIAGCTERAGSRADGSGVGTNTAGELTLETLEVGGSPGGEVTVAPGGELVLLDFFATWCAPCKPQMDELRTVASANPDLHLLSITWESETEAVRSFWTEYEGTWPVAQDTQLRTGQQYGIDNLPTMVLLDAGGEEVWRHTGLAEASKITTEVEAARQ